MKPEISVNELTRQQAIDMFDDTLIKLRIAEDNLHCDKVKDPWLLKRFSDDREECKNKLYRLGGIICPR